MNDKALIHWPHGAYAMALFQQDGDVGGYPADTRTSVAFCSYAFLDVRSKIYTCPRVCVAKTETVLLVKPITIKRKSGLAPICSCITRSRLSLNWWKRPEAGQRMLSCF